MPFALSACHANARANNRMPGQLIDRRRHMWRRVPDQRRDSRKPITRPAAAAMPAVCHGEVWA